MSVVGGSIKGGGEGSIGKLRKRGMKNEVFHGLGEKDGPILAIFTKCWPKNSYLKVLISPLPLLRNFLPLTHVWVIELCLVRHRKRDKGFRSG